MKLTNFIIYALLFISSATHAETPSQIAQDYFNALKQKNYNAAAAYFDPSALNDFRQTMNFVDEIPVAQQQQFFSAFFGSDATKESVAKLSDVEYFSSFFKAVMVQTEKAGGVNFDRTQILGEVMENTDVVHVLTRNKISVGKIEMEAMEVLSCKKTEQGWKVLMSGKIAGLADQLKNAIRKQ